MNRSPRRRILGAVTGVALLLGGAFAAQAVADSGAKPAPKVVTPTESTPTPVAKPTVVKPAPKPTVVKPGPKPTVVKPAPKPTVVNPAPEPTVVKPGTTRPGAAGPAPAENAPRVITPGEGAGK